MSETLTAEQPAAATGTVEVTMPATGSDTQVTVTGWLKHPGDVVIDGEPLCLVGWGESTAEVGSPASGVLRMVTVAAGDGVTVGATLAVIDVRVEADAFGRFSQN